MATRNELRGDLKDDQDLQHMDDDSVSEDGMPLLDQQQEKKLIRRIDWRLLPFMCLLFLLSFLDRANIGNARLAGLEKDLHMRGLMFNLAIAAFFIPYALVEIPSNVIMKRARPSIYIPCMMIAWGVVCMSMGFVKNFNGLVATRVFLGIAEGGLAPGLAFFIGQWYRREETGIRYAIFFSSGSIAGAFGGLFARGLSALAGKANLPGWSWIFIIEGALTIAVAFSGFWILADYPDRAKFLSEIERRHIQWRLSVDHDYLTTDNDSKYAWQALRDWKVWMFSLMGACFGIPLYAFSLFLPTIVRDLGHKDLQAQLMTAPPYVVAFCFVLFAGFLADRIRQRGIVIISFAIVGIIGLLILIASTNNEVKYVGCFFVASGIFPMAPQIITWTSNNIGGSMKRSAGIAFVSMILNIASMASAFLYTPKIAPRYVSGHATLLVLMVLLCLLATIMRTYFINENARREKIKPSNLYTQEEKLLESELGENAAHYRFIP